MRLLTFLIICGLSVSCYGQFSNELLVKAQNGSVAAQMELAACYLEGNGVDLDESQALMWYEKAAENNNVDAMVACGDLLCAEYVQFFEPDYVRGMNWYRKAAAKGNKHAKQIVDNFATSHKEISHECQLKWLPCDDDIELYSTLKEHSNYISAEYQKNPTGAYYLAILAFGDKDYASVVKYLEEIYPFVMNEDSEIVDIFNIDRDYPHSFYIGASVLSLLGRCYEYGLGVDKNYLKAAEYYLSEFEYDAVGMPTTPKIRGAYCLKKAGKHDRFIEEANSQGISLISYYGRDFHYVPCLQLELAEMYRSGDGVQQDKKKALEVYETIVDLREGMIQIPCNIALQTSYEIGEAAYNAAIMYKNGEGCKADNYLYNQYFKIALQYGSENAWYDFKHNK